MSPRIAALLLLGACAHTAPQAPGAVSGPRRDELSKVAVTVAPETVLNDAVLKDRGVELRAALAKALAAEGFQVAEKPGALTVTTSIDYTPWTSVSAASLYVVVALRNEGVSVDQVEVQRINEAFPEAARLDELAQSLAHALAVSPRLAEYLHPAKQ